MRFIHAADLHVDSPLKGLDRYEGAPLDRLRGATRRALERLVDLAVGEKADFVLFAGDLYDGDWADFHTGLYFREQMVRLERAGIRVFIVRGNHDAESQITRQLELPGNVHVFSSRKPETVRIDDLGAALHGQSFPNRAVPEDLVPHYPAPVPGAFNIGLLHTSLTGRPPHDPYAPTRLETLVDKGYEYWALGHVHAREVLSERPRIVFPGNLQGRHARETGPKGCELVTVEAGQVTAEFVALDVVRWSQVEVALDRLDRLAGVGPRVESAIAPVIEGAADRLHAVRVTLTGASALHAEEAARPGTLAAAVQAAVQDLSAAEIWVEQVRARLVSPMDREAAREREDAVGELVRLVDAIGADDEALARWTDGTLGELLRVLPGDMLDDSLPDPSDRDALRALLADAEATVLARLVAGRERP